MDDSSTKIDIIYYFDLLPIELVELLFPLIKIKSVKLPNFGKYKNAYLKFIKRIKEGNFKFNLHFGCIIYNEMGPKISLDMEYWDVDDGLIHDFIINGENINNDNESRFKNIIGELFSSSNGNTYRYLEEKLPYYPIGGNRYNLLHTVLSNNKYYILYSERSSRNRQAKMLTYSDDFKDIWYNFIEDRLKHSLLYQNGYVKKKDRYLEYLEKNWMENNQYWDLK